jgi:hypothetical protein
MVIQDYNILPSLLAEILKQTMEDMCGENEGRFVGGDR